MPRMVWLRYCLLSPGPLRMLWSPIIKKYCVKAILLARQRFRIFCIKRQRKCVSIVIIAIVSWLQKNRQQDCLQSTNSLPHNPPSPLSIGKKFSSFKHSLSVAPFAPTLCVVHVPPLARTLGVAHQCCSVLRCVALSQIGVAVCCICRTCFFLFFSRPHSRTSSSTRSLKTPTLHPMHQLPQA